MRNVLLNLVVVLSVFSVQGCWAGETKSDIPKDRKSMESDPIDIEKASASDKVEQPAHSNLIEIFYLDSNYLPVVNLKPLQPISKQIKAILAMYALQAGGGCNGYDETGLKCELSNALAFEAQCSEEHIEIVRSWFKKEIPPMSGHSESAVERAIKSGNFQSICYHSPDTATRQRIWESIRVNKQDESVLVDAISQVISGSDDLGKRVRYQTKYLIHPDKITFTEHKILILRE